MILIKSFFLLRPRFLSTIFFIPILYGIGWALSQPLLLFNFEEENLLDNAKKVGSYLLSELENLEHSYPAYLTNSRGLGLWAAFDLPSMTERDELWSKMLENKLLILPSGDKSIRFRPHLNVNKQEIDEAIGIIEMSIKQCLK